MSIDLLNQLYDKMSVYGDTYGNTQEDINANQESSDSTGIAPIILPPISSIGSGEGGEENINRNINYDNLIIPSLESKQKSNIFTDAINKFKSFGDKNKLAGGILKAGSFIKDPAMALFTSAMGMLPERDPRQTPLENFYGKNFGLKSDGRIASGVMENYNPVSGGFLNLVTGGKYGEETQYGLERAIDERMDNIINMLSDKYNYSYTNDDQMYKDMLDGKIGGYGIKGHTSAAENYFKMKAIKEGQAKALAATNAAIAEKQRQEFLKSDTRNDPVTGTVAIQKKLGSKTGSASPYQGGSGGLHSNYNSSSTRGTNTNASKSNKSSSSKSSGTNQGYSQHFKDGGIVTL